MNRAAPDHYDGKTGDAERRRGSNGCLFVTHQSQLSCVAAECWGGSLVAPVRRDGEGGGAERMTTEKEWTATEPVRPCPWLMGTVVHLAKITPQLL